MKHRGGYGIIGLFAVLLAALAFLPALRRTFARSFPEGFRNVDCKGVNCAEGEFCQDNVCQPIYPTITNQYFPQK